MPRRTCAVILSLIVTCCITYYRPYIPSYPVIHKGARLKIDCGYEESLRYYDVTAYYVENAVVTCSLLDQDFTDQKHEILTLELVPGDKMVLAIGGSFNRDPYMLDSPYEGFRFIAMVDSSSANDTISLQSDAVETIFYYERRYPFFLVQTGYTDAVDGSFVITNVKNDTLSGIISFEGETQGVYIGNKIIDSQATSWVSGEIYFEATKRKIDRESSIIGRLHIGLESRETND